MIFDLKFDNLIAKTMTLVLLFSFEVVNSSHASTLNFPEQDKIPFHHISVAQGLSQVTVNDIGQDSKGFLWFATEDGLNRYDGKNFVTYHPTAEDNYRISGNVINFVFNDNEQNLWVGFNGQGVSRLNQNKFIPIAIKNRHQEIIENVIATVFFQDKSNRLWLGTWADGLFLYSKKNNSFQQVYSKSEFNRIWTITEYNDKLLIGVNKNGIAVLEKGQPKPWLSSDIINHNTIKTLFTEGNRLWIGTQKIGLWTLYQDKKTNHPNILPIKEVSHSPIQKIFRDHLGTLWVATAGSGIYRKIPHKKWFQQMAAIDKNALSNNRVFSLFQDNTGILWFGTEGAGLNYFDPYSIAFRNILQGEDESKNLNNKMIYAINKDTHNNLWIGTESGGVNIWSPSKNKFQYLNVKSGHLDSNNVRAIIKTKKGMLIGTLNGMSLISEQGRLIKKWNTINLPQLTNNIILSFYPAGINKIWVGTYNGLFLFNLKTEKILASFLDKQNQGPFQNKRAIILSIKQLKSKLYVGTLSDGLYQFDLKNTWKKIQIPLKNEQRDPTIYSILNDNKDNLWLGTKGSGAIKYTPSQNKITFFTQKQGLANNVVYGILQDKNQHLWMSTNRGLSEYNPETNFFTNYSTLDGLQGREFNAGAFFKDNNTFIFGGINGISWFNINAQSNNAFPPETAITSIKVFNKDISTLNPEKALLEKSPNKIPTVFLKYDQTMFTIGFAALHFSAPLKNHYQYRMTGFDKHWIQTKGNQNKTTFTGLQPGTYQFQVKSFSPYQVEDKTPARINVIISPPPWKTWWAYLIYIGTIWLVFNQYLKYLQRKLADQKKINMGLKRIDQLKERLAETERLAILGELSSNIAHSLRNPLASIRSSAELIELDDKLPETIHEDANNIISEVDRLSQWIKDLLEYSKNQKSHVEVIDLKQTCEHIIKDHENKFQLNNIQYDFTVSAKNTLVAVDLLLFQHMLNSLLSNAIEAVKTNGIIKIQLENPDEQHLVLSLFDNGEGIPFEHQTKIFNSSYTTKSKGLGMGLSLVKRIVERHDANIIVESSAGKGTTFYITFGLTKES